MQAIRHKYANMTDTSLTSVLRLLQSARLIEARLAGEFSSVHGLSVNELFLMMQLDAAPRQRLTRVELAKRLNTSASTVTRMAAPMEKLGLVTRETDSRDARLAFVVLTPTGAERLAEAQATLAKRATDVFRDRWDVDEIETLSDLLGRLVVGAPGNLT